MLVIKIEGKWESERERKILNCSKLSSFSLLLKCNTKNISKPISMKITFFILNAKEKKDVRQEESARRDQKNE